MDVYAQDHSPGHTNTKWCTHGCAVSETRKLLINSSGLVFIYDERTQFLKAVTANILKKQVVVFCWFLCCGAFYVEIYTCRSASPADRI